MTSSTGWFPMYFCANLGVWTDFKHLIHFFWLLLVPDPCTPLKKHSFLFPFSLLKNWGDCLFCGGGGGGGMLFRFVFVPIKRYSLFSFFFIQNFKRWEGGWFWSYFFTVIFFLLGGGPESRVQSPESSVHGPVQVYDVPKRWHDK